MRRGKQCFEAQGLASTNTEPKIFDGRLRIPKSEFGIDEIHRCLPKQKFAWNDMCECEVKGLMDRLHTCSSKVTQHKREVYKAVSTREKSPQYDTFQVSDATHFLRKNQGCWRLPASMRQDSALPLHDGRGGMPGQA